MRAPVCRRLSMVQLDPEHSLSFSPAVPASKKPTTKAYLRTETDCWSDNEVKALVEFILFHSKGDSWPCHNRMEFWKAAASFIKDRTNTPHCRSGKSTFYSL